MAREQQTGICESCRRQFRYWLEHCGFGECVYAYCDTCGMTAVLSQWDKRMPELPDCPGMQELCSALEPYLQACDCGGCFKRGSAPRCPHCAQPLSADRAASYIEENAPGAAKGWRWQRNWSGIYCIIIEERRIENNFR